MYAVMKRDYFIFFGNCFGIVLGLWMCISSITILSHKNATINEQNTKEIVEFLVLFGVLFWLIMILTAGVILTDQNTAITMIGILCDFFCIVYYTAPLSTLYTVLRTRNSSSLFVPMIVANLVNAR